MIGGQPETLAGLGRPPLRSADVSPVAELVVMEMVVEVVVGVHQTCSAAVLVLGQ